MEKREIDIKIQVKDFLGNMKQSKEIIQKWVRLRDQKKPCIRVAVKLPMKWTGHFKKAEIYSGVIFNPRNCHSRLKI